MTYRFWFLRKSLLLSELKVLEVPDVHCDLEGPNDAIRNVDRVANQDVRAGSWKYVALMENCFVSSVGKDPGRVREC